ncbi:carbohydrate ABC transporter permease [Vallitalea sp.]|jgi:putative aldouronate transport system permease protein|uniref:carbohydrate ABC transporter permease n=1 Tax=Vallitalea sp. TaxID=1882829 RepID=UPI0025DF613D|nr:carbohydrate ABC transporter permease [Vallitalea sp.]MCT4688767.1 carbohydrate ABC transporter permease [Vallitalea sp.]
MTKSHKPVSRNEKIFNGAMTVVGVIISIVALYPIFYVLIASLSKPIFVENGDVMFWIKGFNFESYKQAFMKDGIWIAYGNTIFYTIVGVFVNMLFTTTMAYALSRERLIFRKFFTLMAIFTMWFNAGMIPLYMTFKDFNLLDTRTAIIVGFAMNTYNLVIMKSFFEQIPKSLEEAAFIDGANNLKIFSRIFLPLSKPALATVGMFYAVTRWNGYFWAMNLLQEDNKVPLQVLLKKLIVDKVANETEAAIVTANSLFSPTTVIYAIIIIAIIPMMIAYPFVQKYFKKGATVGAVKG